MSEELARRFYPVSPGTFYPMLHATERKCHLELRIEQAGRSRRGFNRAMRYGRGAYPGAGQIRELFRDVVAGTNK